MKNRQTQNPVRRAILRIMAYVTLGLFAQDRVLPFWDHGITGKLGSRSQWGFDVHKYHLKNHKYARRR